MSRAMICLVAGVALSALACENKPSSEVAPTDAGVVDKYSTVDPKLENALRAATSEPAIRSNGPPPSGVFAPGDADRRHPAGAPAAVDIVSQGAEPRISLAPSADAQVSGPALLEVSMQMGPRAALPTVDLALMLNASTGEGGPGLLVADVRKATPAKDQPGELSPEADREIAAIAGTSIMQRIAGDGRDSGFDVHLAKEARTDLFARNAAEGLLLATVPLPTQPVGVGARWIAESRTRWAGVDVVTYRAYLIKSIADDRVTLSLDVKGYAATRAARLQGVPAGAFLQQFDAEAQGEIELCRGEWIARRADIGQRVVMVFATTGASAQRAQGQGQEAPALTAQLQGQLTFVRGEVLGRPPRRRQAREPR